MKCRAAILTLLTVVAQAFATPSPGQVPEAKPRKVVKTDQEWAKLLTRNQFLVTRKKATEPPFSGKYATSHAKGTYVCVCCGAELFSSRTKFDSGTGWPSFYSPLTPRSVDTAPDYSENDPRVEVMCMDCGAHLGHVFEDGPPPTGLRYCMNSLALKLIPATAAKAAPKTKKGQDKEKETGDPPTSKPESSSHESAPAEKVPGTDR
jgi:peptide-methionine (R)-S-oxide reductase